MRVNLADVIDAIDTINEDETYFYSIQDEEIVYALEDDEDDEFFIPLPTKEEVNDKSNNWKHHKDNKPSPSCRYFTRLTENRYHSSSRIQENNDKKNRTKNSHWLSSQIFKEKRPRRIMVFLFFTINRLINVIVRDEIRIAFLLEYRANVSRKLVLLKVQVSPLMSRQSSTQSLGTLVLMQLFQ